MSKVQSLSFHTKNKQKNEEKWVVKRIFILGEFYEVDKKHKYYENMQINIKV